MAELVKSWPDGGNLSVSYTGVNDGEAVFRSDQNEGIDREMTVTFKGAGREETLKVTQVGLREPFRLAGGGVFRVKGGGRFAVLKADKEYTDWST